jgi:hypothetical protein
MEATTEPTALVVAKPVTLMEEFVCAVTEPTDPVACNPVVGTVATPVTVTGDTPVVTPTPVTAMFWALAATVTVPT